MYLNLIIKVNIVQSVALTKRDCDDILLYIIILNNQ